MSEMIERVARALCRKHVEKNLRSTPGCAVDPEIIERAIDHSWSDYILNACAAIEAMRDIPQDMVDAGNSALSSNGVDNVEDDDAALCWQAMIEFATSQDAPSLPAPAATPTDSANPSPVGSVGTSSEAQP